MRSGGSGAAGPGWASHDVALFAVGTDFCDSRSVDLHLYPIVRYTSSEILHTFIPFFSVILMGILVSSRLTLSRSLYISYHDLAGALAARE